MVQICTTWGKWKGTPSVFQSNEKLAGLDYIPLGLERRHVRHLLWVIYMRDSSKLMLYNDERNLVSETNVEFVDVMEVQEINAAFVMAR